MTEIPTPAEFAAEMRAIFPKEGYDEEGAHGYADGRMCDLLRALGYEEAVEIFEKAKKWYA